MKEIPLLFGKPSDKALFDPEHFLEHANIRTKIDIAIIFFNSKTGKLINKKYKIKKKVSYEKSNFSPIKIRNKNIIFTKSHIGGSGAVALAEELIALGVQKIIFIGSCGTLQNIPISSIILPTRAIRDEGTSYHYAKASKYAKPSKELFNLIEKTTKELNIKYNKGTTWTTDAPYRETFRKINKYSLENTISVEMEASALFTLGKYRNVEVAAIFWISDQLLKKWTPGFKTKEYNNGVINSFKILEKVLEKLTK